MSRAYSGRSQDFFREFNIVNEMKAAGHKEIRKVSKAEAEKMISNGSKYFDADKVLDKFTIGFRIEEI